MDERRSELRDLVRRLTAGRRRGLRVALVVVVACSLVGLVWAGQKDRVRAFARGEIDLAGQPRYEPRHPPSAEALASIDFARVHGELLTAWTLALARARSPSGRRYADRAFEELEKEVAPDPNLRELVAGMHRGLREDPIANAERLDYLFWAYDHYLESQRVPWRVDATLVLAEDDRAVLYALAYEVMVDARTRSGQRLRLLRRADRTNAVEGWYGHTSSQDGAVVLMQRAMQLALAHVWPALSPAIDARRPAAERPWLEPVRAEVRAALDPATFELLAQTAPDRQAILDVARAVSARAACGSRFRIGELPYHGLSPRGRGAIERALARSVDAADCPEITLDEAASIIGASERLGSTEGLPEAIERLTMLVARSVAVHELQHAEDGEEPACHGCPKWLYGVPRAEVSAYLSAMSTEGLGYLALLQACASPPSETVQGASLRVVLEAILPFGCEGPTRHDLYTYAERIETRLFGKRGDIALPALPDRVALLPRRTGAPRRPTWRPLDTGWGVAVVPRAQAHDRSPAFDSVSTPGP